MLERLSDIQKERAALGIIIAVGLMRFLNLGFLDLQAWDEALYALRAEGILRFGGWIDQTPFAVDGFYSSLHPPLYVWLTAVSFALFGVTEFAARFFSALFGGLILLVIYRIGKRVGDIQVGLISALLFGLNPFVAFFARQGQFDASLTFFLALAILFLVELQEHSSARQAVFAGLAVGAALMTKLFVGLGIPLAYLLWIVTRRSEEKRARWKWLAVVIVVAILVAAPWHIFMTVVHGKGDPFFFIEAAAVFERSVYGIEGNIKPLEALYFLNQLVVLFPFGVAWLGPSVYRVIREKQPGWSLMGMWFLVFFVVFSLMRTKLAVYLLPMLVPASLLAAKEITKVSQGAYSRRSASVFLIVTLLSFLWSSSQAWRNAVKALGSRFAHFELPSAFEVSAVLPLLALACLVLGVWYLSLRKAWIDSLRPALPYLILVPCFVISYYQIIGYERFRYKDGAAELADCILERQPSEIIVAGYERNPQLSYYLEGADIGWRDDLTVKRIIPPKDRHLFRSWLTEQLSGLPEEAFVVIEKDKFIRYEWVTVDEVIPPDYALVFESRRYAAIQRIRATQYAHLRPD